MGWTMVPVFVYLTSRLPAGRRTLHLKQERSRKRNELFAVPLLLAEPDYLI
jgi:hypothetical protein